MAASMIWDTVFMEPLFNALAWLVAHMPGFSIGLAVIILTIVVKMILSPLAYKSTLSQIAQKKLQPEIQKIKEKYKDKKEQSQKTMELYKKHKTNPFSGCLVLLIQLPIILALYRVFLLGMDPDSELIYQALEFPKHVNNFFLGIDMTEKSIIIAILAGVAQFFQLRFSPALRRSKKEKEEAKTKKPEDPNKKKDFMSSMGANMQKHMKYTMPIVIIVIGLAVPAAVALYWVVTALFTMVQELMIQRRIAQKEASV